MAERRQLSAERLRLIRAFMGEPWDAEDDRAADPPRPETGPAVAEAPPTARDDPRLRMARPDAFGRAPRTRRAWTSGLRVLQSPRTGWSPRSRIVLGWPVAAVVVGLVVGVLIARSV